MWDAPEIMPEWKLRDPCRDYIRWARGNHVYMGILGGYALFLDTNGYHAYMSSPEIHRPRGRTYILKHSEWKGAPYTLPAGFLPGRTAKYM